MKKKHSLTFSDKDWEYFQSLSNDSGQSISQLIVYAMEKAYQNPLDIILEQERELNNKLKLVINKKIKLQAERKCNEIKSSLDYKKPLDDFYADE
jgi:hypothetical protein